jgi:ribose 1,5-bisphosphokinase PhnN
MITEAHTEELMGIVKYRYLVGILPTDCHAYDPVSVFDKLSEVKSVAIVGTSGSGKSTLVDVVRNSELVHSGVVDIPTRYVTRAREKDNPLENKQVTHEEFDELKSSGQIDLAWKRNLGGERPEQYGFSPANEHSALTIYSANDAFFQGRHEIVPQDRLETMLFMMAKSSEETRAERLRKRSPELFEAKAAEGSLRLAPRTFNTDLDVLAWVYNRPHHFIFTEGEKASYSAANLVYFLGQLAALQQKSKQDSN